MPIRNGRFRSDAAGSQEIIKGKNGAFYRVLNSGENPITLTSGTLSQAIPAAASLDFVIGDTVQVTSTAAYEGIYIYLQRNDPDVRSGRFNLQATTARRPIILLGSANVTAHYRFLNSGANPVELYKAETGGAALAEVKADQSLDFVVGKSGVKAIWVIGKDTTKPTEGIYDFLGLG